MADSCLPVTGVTGSVPAWIRVPLLLSLCWATYTNGSLLPVLLSLPRHAHGASSSSWWKYSSFYASWFHFLDEMNKWSIKWIMINYHDDILRVLAAIHIIYDSKQWFKNHCHIWLSKSTWSSSLWCDDWQCPGRPKSFKAMMYCK